MKIHILKCKFVLDVILQNNTKVFYGVYGKDETTKSSVIWILIPEILLNWRKESLYSGLRRSNSLTREIDQTRSLVEAIIATIPGRWCFTDESWKNQDAFLEQGWYRTLEGFVGLMGARNTRASQLPLHSEMEAFIWAMKCMRNLRQFNVTFKTDCSQLVKMVSEPEEWPAFASYLEDIKILKRSFHSSELIHIPMTHNSRADSQGRSARKQPSFVVHMDAELPVWFTESI